MTSSINHEQEYQQAWFTFKATMKKGNQVDQLVQDFLLMIRSYLLWVTSIRQQYDFCLKTLSDSVKPDGRSRIH